MSVPSTAVPFAQPARPPTSEVRLAYDTDHATDAEHTCNLACVMAIVDVYLRLVVGLVAVVTSDYTAHGYGLGSYDCGGVGTVADFKKGTRGVLADYAAHAC